MEGIHISWRPLFDVPAAELAECLPTLEEEVYPPREQIFTAFTMPVTDIKVVLLGQDPYHGPGQAHGLSFSVPEGIPIPPSRAKAIAKRSSVTVSMAADTMGMLI